MSTDVVEAVVRVHGGVKFYHGAAKTARSYLESDYSRADDCYLGEGLGLAMRFVAEATSDGQIQLGRIQDLDGDAYEGWVAGLVVETGEPKGRLRKAPEALRFVEVTVNGPKTWLLAAALDPTVSAALDAAQERAARQIVSYLAEHATTRVGPRGRQVQVPVEQIEAAVIRHYTSRAGDPHRHLHLQVNARVFAEEKWRGLHTVGVRDMIEAINGIGHAAVATDPEFRTVLAARGFTLNAETGEVEQLAPYVGAFSARTGQIHRNIDRYEAEWRREHPGEEPGPRLGEAWDRRAWADARPDKAVPANGAELVTRWNAAPRMSATGTVLAMSLAARSVPFAEKPMKQVRRAHVETWIKQMNAAGLAPGTIKTRYVNVRSVFRATVKDRVIGTDPTDGVRLPRGRRSDMAMSIPAPEEVGQLMAVADERFQPFIALCAFAGLRLG